MSRLLICGYYGFGNTGDEAILTVLLAGLRRRFPDLDVTVVAGDPEFIRAEYGTRAISWQDIPGLVTAAGAADVMVLGGGGLFQDYWGCHPERILTPRHGNIDYWAGFALLARLLDKPLVLYAVGVGPLTGEAARRYTRLACDHAGTVTVRSEGSLQLLTEIGVDPDRVQVTADPAWLLDPAPGEAVDELLATESVGMGGKLRIGVSVRPWGTDATRLEEMAVALDRLVAGHDADVVFIPLHTSPSGHENDAQAATEIASKMQHLRRATILRGEYTPSEILALVGSCDLTVGMRLHSVIFSARMGVPVVSLSYDPKVEQTMTELGAEASTLDYSTFTSEALVKACEAALIKPGADTAAVGRLRERAARNDAALAAMIERPIVPEPTGDLIAAVQRLAVHRALDQGDQDTVAAERELAEVRADRDRLRSSYEGLDALHQEFLGARAVRAVQSYWKVREKARTGLRSTAGRVARRLPTPMHRYLRRWAPPRPAETLPQAIDPVELADLRRQISKQLNDLLELHADAPGFVVYPPSIGWGVTLFQRPQQMALAFARLGYVVLYGLGWGNPEGVRGLREYVPRLYLTSMPEQLLDLYRRIAEPVFISYVYNFEWHRHLERPITVYEHIDDLDVFTHAYDHGDLTAWHEVAVREADVAVASAVDLHNELLRSRPDAVLVPNGVDYRHFAGSRAEVPEDIADLAGSGKPIIGYYGAVAEWIDYDLIEHAATALPDYHFLLIGPDYDGSARRAAAFDLPNVRWLGPRNYDDLPLYLRQFDVATIPFVVTDVTHGVSPLKLFEYMAGGTPIVTPALRECARYRAVLTAESPDDYVSLLTKAVQLGDDPDHTSLLRRTARANTWGRRAGTLIDAVVRARST